MPPFFSFSLPMAYSHPSCFTSWNGHERCKSFCISVEAHLLRSPIWHWSLPVISWPFPFLWTFLWAFPSASTWDCLLKQTAPSPPGWNLIAPRRNKKSGFGVITHTSFKHFLLKPLHSLSCSVYPSLSPRLSTGETINPQQVISECLAEYQKKIGHFRKILQSSDIWFEGHFVPIQQLLNSWW